MSRWLSGIALAAAALLPPTCVSMDYGPIGPEQPYGYSERQRDDGAYILSVVHPDETQAMAFWDARAKELCGAAGYTKNIYQATRPTVLYSNYGGMAGDVVLEGLLTCKGPDKGPDATEAGADN